MTYHAFNEDNRLVGTADYDEVAHDMIARQFQDLFESGALSINDLLMMNDEPDLQYDDIWLDENGDDIF